ncbi:MAG TPA: phosphatase PAP2 family protein [Chitinophagales bacterium]|nr:phosphatase PAP2 family protein [Chitinophagales bacterium]
MMDGLVELDRELLKLINTTWANSFFDATMPFARAKFNWIPLYVAMLIWLVFRFKKNVWLPLIVIVGAVAVSDQIASSVFKPFFERLRPCRNPELELRMIIDCGGGFGFVSSHAATHFAVALTFPFFFREHLRWLLPVMLLWACWVAYAQIYVGYHYPSDIVCGALVGTTVAFVATSLARKKLNTHQPA